MFFCVLECAQIWQFHVLFSPFLPLGIFCHCAVSLCLFPSMMSLSLLYTALGAVKFVHNPVVFLYFCMYNGTVLVLERLKARLCTQFDCEFFFVHPWNPQIPPCCVAMASLESSPAWLQDAPALISMEKKELLRWPCVCRKTSADMAFHYLIDSTKGLNTVNIYWRYIPELSEQNQAWPSNVLNIMATSQKPSKTFNGEMVN